VFLSLFSLIHHVPCLLHILCCFSTALRLYKLLSPFQLTFILFFFLLVFADYHILRFPLSISSSFSYFMPTTVTYFLKT
jgi:hypothetical protein